MIEQTCTRRIQFAAGHRVYGHENLCANMHGHNYVVFLEAHPDGSLDKIGRVIDFSVLKNTVGKWIEDNWDHAFLYFKQDRECSTLFGADERFITQKSFKCEFNPTAEEMARYLLFEVGPKLLSDKGVTLKRVTVWETENCYATAEIKE